MTAWVRSRSPSFISTRLTCVLTVSSLTTRAAGALAVALWLIGRRDA
jgi:hypothetical protein